MALTQISTQGIKDGTISSVDLADQSVTLAKLPHGTSSNDGKFLRANNGADPTFETVSSIGGSTGVDFDDNVKARFGTGNDLQIYHDGTNSHIDNATGALVIDVEGNTQVETNSFFVLTNDNENAIRAFANGAVELYHNNTKMIETDANGVKVGDSKRYIVGDDADGYLRYNSNTVELYVAHAQPFKVSLGGETAILATANGSVDLYHNNVKRFETTNTGITISGSDTTGSIVQGDFRFKKADGTQHIVYDASNSRMNFADNISATFGDANDLKIFHDGSNSQIREEGTGNLMLITNNQIRFEKASPGEAIASFNVDGACELYHDNSKKLETTSGGIDISGDVVIDGAAGGTLTLGGSSAHTSKLVIADNAGSGNGNLLVEGGDGTDFFTINSAGNVKFVDNKKALFGTDADLEIFYDSSANSKIQSNGSLTIKHQNGDKFIHCSSNSDVELYHDGTKKCNTDSQGISIQGRIHTQIGTDFNTFNKTGTGKLVSLMTNGTERGNISSNGSTVQFNTTASDKSLKKNFENWTENTLSLFKNINAQKFNFLDQEDGTDKEKGFIAQDMVASFPEAYQKNDDDKYMFNPSGMVIYLMKAIQELEAEVAALKAG